MSTTKAKTKLLLPDDARALALRKLERHRRAWLDGQAEWPLSINLGAVTEKEAVAAWPAVRKWAEAWAAWTGPGEVQWQERKFPAMGAQRLPGSLVLGSAHNGARLAGASDRYELAQRRRDELVQRWPQLADGGASRHYDTLADYPDAEFARLTSLLAWLDANPSSGHYLRHLPVEGLDTKWIGSRTGLVGELLRAIRSAAEADDFYALCGLSKHPQRIRMRVLCTELQKATGGLTDVLARIDDLAHLTWQPQCILVVENQETGVALPQLPGVVAFQEMGNAVSLLGAIPWLRGVPVFYWGDIDTDGFAILNQARLVLPHARSILMDEATLLQHRSMWVTESRMHPVAVLSQLDAAESALYADLRDGRWGKRVRLEQERVPWAYAMERLKQALAS